jgi:hypothetical protein
LSSSLQKRKNPKSVKNLEKAGISITFLVSSPQELRRRENSGHIGKIKESG